MEASALGVISLTDQELLKKIHQRIVWHEKVLRYSPAVRAAMNHLRERKRVTDDTENEIPVVFQTDIQHVVTSGLSRIVPTSVERSVSESAWSCIIQGPMRAGAWGFMKVWIFMSDDESELVRVDNFLLAE